MSAPIETEKIFYTPEEVADRYHGKVTVRTLANWRSMGISPPYTKIGGRILYPVKELLEWEQNRTVSSTSKYTRIGAIVSNLPMLTGWLVPVISII